MNDPTPPRAQASVPLRALYSTDVIYFLAIFLAVLTFAPRNSIWVIGLSFAIANFALWMIARWQLGRSFTIGAHARELVNTGLYRKFSHPIYLFGTLSHLGVMIALQQWWLLPLWFGIPAPFQLTRMRKEDAILEEQFGQPFRQLRAGNWI